MPRKKLSTAPLIKQIEEQALKIATLEGTIRTLVHESVERGREHDALDEEHDKTVADLLAKHNKSVDESNEFAEGLEDKIEDLEDQLEAKEKCLKDAEEAEGKLKKSDADYQEEYWRNIHIGEELATAKAFLRALSVTDFEQAVCSDATDPVQALGNLRARRAA